MVALPPDPPGGPDSDPFKPPPVNTEVHCMHCDEVYDSYKIHWVEDASWEINGGYWACPTPECDGKGFCFDIWPTDPEWRDEEGNKVWIEDEEDPDLEGLDDELSDAPPDDE